MIVARYSRIFVRSAAPTIRPANIFAESAARRSERPRRPPRQRNRMIHRFTQPRRLLPKILRASARRSPRCSPTSRARLSWMQDLDPEEARAIIDPALKLMIDAVHRYDGYIVQIDRRRHLRAVRRAARARGSSATRTLRRTQDAGGVAPLFGESGGRRRHSDPGPHRYQHRRSRGPLDSDRRGPCRVHADRAHDQPGIADADRGAGRFDRSDRNDAQALRRLLRPQAARRNQSQRRQRAGECL